MVKRRGEALCDTEEHVQKAREGSHKDFPLLLNYFRRRPTLVKKPADSHNLPHASCGKLAPWPSHGSRDSSRTQACIYKAEGEDLSPPLLLQLNPAPAYSPTNTLRSTIGDEVLNCQVRHGAGCVHLSMSTGNFLSTS